MRISKRKLDEEILLKIYRLFFEVISRFDTEESFFQIFDDILYPTEKIMIAKRVAIIYLLLKGIEQDAIAQSLKVSTATVSRYAALFYEKDQKIVTLLKSMITKEKALNFLEDTFADLLIQPGIKVGHWQSYWDHKRKKDRREQTGF